MAKHPAMSMLVATVLLIVLVLVMGCDSPREDPEKAPGPVASATQEPSVKQRWNAMTNEEREAVCVAMSGPLPGENEIGGAGSQSDGVDYRKVLWELEAAGFSQNESAAMIPYALKECR